MGFLFLSNKNLFVTGWIWVIILLSDVDGQAAAGFVS